MGLFLKNGKKNFRTTFFQKMGTPTKTFWTPNILGPLGLWWVGVEGYPRSKVTYRGVFGANGSKSVVGFGVALYGASASLPHEVPNRNP